MKKLNSQIFNAVLTTILACSIVFALALYIFGFQGFLTNKTPITTSITPTISGTVIIPISLDKTGSMATGAISCILDYKPVCGTDNKTYSNACFANAQGVIVENEGVCQNDKSGTIATPPSTNTGARACTLEYAPVCGADGRTYSNTCMAGDIDIAYMGECSSTSTGTIYDTGSYLLYANSRLGYGFAMPRYSHYAGLGARDGAVHSVVIATTASGVLEFANAPVQIWLYSKIPANPPSSQSVQLDAGVLYIRNNDTTGNVKITNIVDTVMASAK